MYPALEITLRLDRIRAAQRPVPAAVEAAFQSLHVRHQPAPFGAARHELRAFEATTRTVVDHASRSGPDTTGGPRGRTVTPGISSRSGGVAYAADSTALDAGRLSSSGSPALEVSQDFRSTAQRVVGATHR